MTTRQAITLICAGLAVLFLAGKARAGSFTSFAGCAPPPSVPIAAFATIEDEASASFGTLSQKACKSITAKGVATCKSQVKLAAGCNNQQAGANASIALKQCDSLADSMDRSSCKTSVKNNLKSIKGTIKDAQSAGIATCKGEFAAALQDACENGIVPVGGP